MPGAGGHPRRVGVLRRVFWFAVATAIGVLWAFGAAITGRPLELHAHAVLGFLVASALAEGGFAVAAFRQWQRASADVVSQLDIPARHHADVRALVAALIEHDPSILTAVRRALGPGRRDHERE